MLRTRVSKLPRLISSSARARFLCSAPLAAALSYAFPMLSYAFLGFPKLAALFSYAFLCSALSFPMPFPPN